MITPAHERGRPLRTPSIEVHPPYSPALVARRPHWALQWAKRLAVVAAAGLAASALYVLVAQPLLPERGASSQPTPVERPQTIPARPPDWYWDFRRWRISLAPPQG